MQNKEYNEREIISDERNYKVAKSNDIIRNAKHDLNIMELKIMAFIFSKIKPYDTQLEPYKLKIKDYCQICGIDYKNGNNYKNIKKTIKGLRDKSFWWTDENGNEVTIGWISKVKMIRGNGEIEVFLDDDMHKHVIGLKNNYTQYSFIYTIPMKSGYSFRMYELLQSYAFIKKANFDIDELKEYLCAKNYVNFKDFRRQVLDISVKEINKYTDLEISWEPIKKGKKVINVKFYINKKTGIDELESQISTNEHIKQQISLFDYEYYKQ